MVDLTTTNVWLAILAIVGLIEFVMICVAGFFAYRMYQRAMATLETVERVHIAPLHARVNGILDEVQTITFKVKHAQESVSDAVRHMTGTGSAIGVRCQVAYVANSRHHQGFEDCRRRRDEKRTERPRSTVPTALCRLLLHSFFANSTPNSVFVQVRALQHDA